MSKTRLGIIGLSIILTLLLGNYLTLFRVPSLHGLNPTPTPSESYGIPQVFPSIGPNPISSKLLPSADSNNFNSDSTNQNNGSGGSGPTQNADTPLQDHFLCTVRLESTRSGSDFVVAIRVSTPDPIAFAWARLQVGTKTYSGEIKINKGIGFQNVVVKKPLPNEEVFVEIYPNSNLDSQNKNCSSNL